MGRVLGPETLIKARDAKVGDLVVFTENGSRATAIVFEFNEDREPLVGMLEGDDRPRRRRINDDELCANLGSDWLFEPGTGSATGPGHFDVGRRAGLLVLTRSGWAINFATSNMDALGRFSWEWRNPASGVAVPRIEKGQVVDHWKLWANEHDRDRSGSSPLLTYEAIATSTSRNGG